MDIFGLLEQDTPYDNHDHMIKYFSVLLMIKYISPNHIFCLIWANEMNSKPSEEPFGSLLYQVLVNYTANIFLIFSLLHLQDFSKHSEINPKEKLQFSFLKTLSASLCKLYYGYLKMFQ